MPEPIDPTPGTDWTIETPACMCCGQRSFLTITAEENAAYFERRELIQLAFPNRDADFREQLKSGTHPACWTEMFGDDEEDDDE